MNLTLCYGIAMVSSLVNYLGGGIVETETKGIFHWQLNKFGKIFFLSFFSKYIGPFKKVVLRLMVYLEK